MAKKAPASRSKKIKAATIEAKDQRWHCRNRVTLVFGSNDVEELDTYIYSDKSLDFKTVKFHQAKSKAIEEILDNCIDEFYRGHVTTIKTSLSKDGLNVVVEDDGIGILKSKEMFKSSFFPENKTELENIHLDAYNRHIKFIEKTCRVLVNSLLYLSLPKENKDIQTKFPKDLPHNFNRKLAFAKTEKQNKKIKKKIIETGFSKIQYVGLSFSNNKKNVENSGIELSPHWRRGHWRNQAFGTNLKKNKLIWIKPTIVNKDIGNPEKGHVYEIKN